MSGAAGKFPSRTLIVLALALLVTFGVVAGVTRLVDHDLGQQSRLINVSCRGSAGTGPEALLMAFVVSERAQTVVVRARRAAPRPASETGPDLLLRIVRNIDGVDLGRNEGWKAPGNERLQTDLKPFVPAEPTHPACVLTLPPGGYSALVEDRSGGHATVGIELFVIRE